MSDPQQVLSRLADVIDRRYRERPDGSYTTLLFNSGLANMVGKFAEEAAELVEAAAAVPQRGERVRHEAADLLFHLLVVLRACQVSLDDVWAELARREGQSGLAERKSRDRS
ncbi:MAG: phosphoribosyl-ATP diphosphatase [Planctomycetales bacterium]|nr:phosphoribosyl-ATP diphosphatase [Planctomycetales bacterium]NIM08384.1 phosphoribosyl-ATP diphosphatase [Planctomycetales bacterium]NIN07859.1 phosphoribosyl-ATP diphosphatase [Planctomycetales bacterium]NIN76990.1 phosphoribosyl-ATP diphosphatase [Planctomycetales bacterium]NIO34173.1 phosphoribosyl-ATP diphosphatase [Planctomycetales bacterium]